MKFDAINLREAHERPEADENCVTIMTGTNLNNLMNALKYFDCKQKVSGTQLDILDNQIETQIYSTFDEKIYYLNSASSQELNLIYETEDYISSMTIDPNLEMVFSINYKAYDKKWSYDLKCVSLKKE